MGVKHFCMGWDVGILFDWFKGNGAKLRAMMGDRRRHKGVTCCSNSFFSPRPWRCSWPTE